MNTHEKATPRPWVCNGGPDCLITTKDVRKSVADCFECDGHVETRRANAALIVQAVNEYDALNAVAEAAVQIRNCLDWGCSQSGKGMAVEAFDAALAQLSALRNSSV